ncbi:non-ribosomal peptide synthetase, partial [Pseudoalteromonas luteoviolacea]|uniref:AMP-binding enzyme n=1 Tax=Pseudoalteromonas luteoviolacea TaxID=43657 RepID=UPI003F801A38|nr:non-ribosomal peptide synthetase [Pseudoalteromonas luteoviolacea]
DDQLKIRGFRIELGEVEHHLNQCEGVDSAVVMAAGEVGEQQLVGYIKADVDKADYDWVSQVRAQLSTRIPSHMLPSVLIPITDWPLTPNGKLQRSALPSIDGRQLSREYIAPETDTEKALVAIWATLLKLQPEHISVTANFFE